MASVLRSVICRAKYSTRVRWLYGASTTSTAQPRQQPENATPAQVAVSEDRRKLTLQFEESKREGSTVYGSGTTVAVLCATLTTIICL